MAEQEDNDIWTRFSSCVKARLESGNKIQLPPFVLRFEQMIETVAKIEKEMDHYTEFIRKNSDRKWRC